MSPFLRSPVAGLSDDELCAVKLAGPKTENRFYALCDGYAASKKDETAEKLKEFFALTKRYLALSYTRTAAELIGMLTAEKNGLRRRCLPTRLRKKRTR